ncbi:MAG: hypothetical protein QXH03_10295 [Candidatus Bathyarchaeia archaeon]
MSAAFPLFAFGGGSYEIGRQLAMTLQEFLQLAEQAGLQPRQRANGEWRMRCPAHEDEIPSLDVREGERGLLLQCRAGCSVEAICAALGISVSDLFFEKQSSSTRGCRIDDLSLNCQDLELALAELGCQETHYNNIPAVAFPYQTPEGEIFYHFRVAPEGKSKWLLQHGAPAKRLIFNLRKALERAKDMNFLIITESPLDAATLWACGFAAIATVGKANAAALSEFSGFIPEDLTVCAWIEPQAEDFAQNIANALQRPIKAFTAQSSQLKDAWRILRENSGDIERTRQQVEQLMASSFEVTPNLQPLNNEKHGSECPFCQLQDDELLKVAEPLLNSDDPLEFAAQLIEHATGIVAERKNIKLLLLIATTRIFEQPLHAYIVAPTGAGKSALTNAVVQSLPPCQVQRLVGASALSLLAHELREGTLVEWKEAPHHWHENSLSATVLRSVLWQQPHEKGAYLTLEYTNKRGYRKIRWQLPKRLSFLMTSTEPPKDPQLRTRLWLIELEETPERRLAILNAIAEKFTLNGSQRPTLEPLMAFNEFLARQSIFVKIPFAHFLAHQLAETMPATRDFRDFEGLLKLIAANAIWNWASRKKDETANEVVIIATPDDYASVFALVQDAWKADRSDVTASQRRVYDAIANWSDGQLPSCADIARKLRVTDEAVRKALKALLGKRLIEEVDGRPKRYRVIADIVPTVILPDPETVRMATQHGSLDAGLPASQPEANFPTQSQLGVSWQKNSTNTGVSDHFQLFQLSYHIRSANRQEQHTSDNDLSDLSLRVCSKVELEKLENGKKPIDTGTTLPTTPKLEKVSKVGYSEADMPEVGQLEWFRCPNCGLRRLMSPDSWLLAGKCPECGSDMAPDQPNPPSGGSSLRQPQTDDANGKSEEKLVDTLTWFEREIEFVNSPDLADNQPPPIEPEPDQLPRKTKLPPSSCRQLANDLLRILRQFQRSSKKHQRCLTDPCPTCRAKARQVRYLERTNSRNGLRALWQRAQAWQQQQGGVGA